MRRSRLLTLTAGCLAAVSASVALALPGTASAAVNYVALGDSYSSGLGAGSYTSQSGACDRSVNAYPQLWSTAHAPSSYVSVACSGAKTTDVNATQLTALSSATSLVSITIGGNDVGFSTVMETCVLEGTTRCVAAINGEEAKATSTLPGLLDTTYTGISSHAPHAKVVVLGYPLFYDLSVPFCIGLSGTSRAKIDEGINLVDGIISAAAGRHGFTFADVRTPFVGHEICDGAKWLHALNYFDISESYHPTADGQSLGYLPAFTAAAG